MHPLFESPTSKKKRKRGAEAHSNTDSGSSQNPAQAIKDSASPPTKPIAEAQEPLPSIPISEEGVQEIKTSQTETQQSDPALSDPPTAGRYDFYLLRPRTSSSRRVLVPLTSSDTLGDALRGCTVEEFPTIYYFPAATPELPTDFMLEEDYKKEEGEQQREFEELMKDVDPEILKRLRDDGTKSRADEEVDSKKILDVLKQDLGRL